MPIVLGIGSRLHLPAGTGFATVVSLHALQAGDSLVVQDLQANPQKRHWLDPLARRILRLTTAAPRPEPTGWPSNPDEEAVEVELLRLKLHQNPTLRFNDAVMVRRAARLGITLDVNRAPAAEWLRLPGSGWDVVDQLLRLQHQGVQFTSLDDLGRQIEISRELLLIWQPLLLFRCYSADAALRPKRVDVNHASHQKLALLPGLDHRHLTLLLRERQRSRFRNLADLRDRLQLPDAVLEAWAGQLEFGRGPIQPQLPMDCS